MTLPEELFQCQMANCGYIYHPNRGDKNGKIPPATRFENLPPEWHCPGCGAGRQRFRPLAGPGSVKAEIEAFSGGPDKPRIS